MTKDTSARRCVLCDEPATQTVEPPRRTLARGVDPSDPSFSVTVILPDIALCAEHALDIRQGTCLVGWCDDELCRTYGPLDAPSACGHPYERLGASKRA